MGHDPPVPAGSCRRAEGRAGGPAVEHGDGAGARSYWASRRRRSRGGEDERLMFRVGVTRDFLRPDGTVGFGDIGLGRLDEAGIAWDFLPDADGEIRPDHARDFDGLLVLAPRVTARTVEG